MWSSGQQGLRCEDGDLPLFYHIGAEIVKHFKLRMAIASRQGSGSELDGAISCF
jgi:hypothetical protein